MKSVIAFALTAILFVATGAEAQVAFTYHAPGDLLSGRGHKKRDIHLPNMRFPIPAGPSSNNQHAYANSQLHTPSPQRFAYPWRDTYCEERHWNMPLCPAGKGHQGIDIRPNGNDNNAWTAVAMDDGVVTSITRNTTVIIRASSYTCRYLHMDFNSIAAAGLQVGKQVRKGDPVGKISNIMGGTPNTSIHLHFDCHKVINGTTVFVPIYASLVSAYRTAWGLTPLVQNGMLEVDQAREVGATAGGGGVTPPPIDATQPKTFQTKNWGAITPQTEPDGWPAYIKTWPNLLLSVQIRDAFGKIIPAFSTDEAGVGLWWYWMVRRANFGREGSVSLQQIAFKYSGAESITDAVVESYASSYSGTPDRPGLVRHYFGRFVPKNELLSLGDKETRWRVAQTLFHHEAGKPAPFSRTVFEKGVELADDILDGGTGQPGSGPTPPPPVVTPTKPGEVCLPPAMAMELTLGKYVLRFSGDVDNTKLSRVLDLLEKRQN